MTTFNLKSITGIASNPDGSLAVTGEPVAAPAPSPAPAPAPAPAPPPSSSYPATVAAHEWAKPVWDARNMAKPTPTKLPGRDPLPSGAIYQPATARSDKQNTVIVTGPNVVLDGYDFRAANTAVKADGVNTVIRNSIMGGTGVHVPLWCGRTVPNCSALVENSEIDGLGKTDLFAGMVQVGQNEASSSLTLRRVWVHNSPREVCTLRGKFLADQCWFGGPAMNGKAGDHVSAAHVYGGSAKFTNCLFDGQDVKGKHPPLMWTAWLFFEPYAAGQNIDGGLIENCILVNPHEDGWYMINATDVKYLGTVTRNLVVRNNIIQGGQGGQHFYPGWLPCYSEIHDNFDFATGKAITEYPDKRP